MSLTRISTYNIDFSSNLVFANVYSMNVATLNAGDVQISGNLTVSGTTVTVNTNVLDVKDLNITVAKGAGSSALSNSAGLTVDFPNAQIFYTSSNDSWNVNKALNTTNTVTIGTGTYFAANGNVGIGTSSPSDKVVISGSSSTTIYQKVTNGTQNVLFGISAGNVPLVGTTSNDPLLLYTNNAERMRITPAGDVGIGTSSPSSKLTVAGSITPSVDNTHDLGSASLRWANVYTGDLNLSNEGSSGNEVDGTTGKWTIQEGEDSLFIINKKNGKKYKFVLEEIE